RAGALSLLCAVRALLRLYALPPVDLAHELQALRSLHGVLQLRLRVSLDPAHRMYVLLRMRRGERGGLLHPERTVSTRRVLRADASIAAGTAVVKEAAEQATVPEDPAFEALWAHVLGHWEDDKAHVAFLEHCQA